MSTITSALVFTVKFVNSVTVWQHRFDAVLTTIRVFCYVLLHCPQYNFAQNVISSSFGGSDYLV